MTTDKPFKVCTMCSTAWETRDQFIKDDSLQINGYQVDFETIDWSLFFFTHEVPGCNGTMAIEATAFLDLYTGERYTERRALLDGCPRYCLDQEQLARCEAQCECAFNREVINLINQKRLCKEI